MAATREAADVWLHHQWKPVVSGETNRRQWINKNLPFCVGKLKGPVGTDVKIRVKRYGSKEPLEWCSYVGVSFDEFSVIVGGT